MTNTQLNLFSANKQASKSTNHQLPKIFTAILALILSLILSFAPNSCFASSVTNIGSTNTSFFNNTAAVATTAAVGALGLGAILVGLLSNNSNNNNNNSNNDSPTAVLISIAVTPHAPSIASGTTQQFTATGTFNDGTTQDLTKSVTWHSNHTSVATISNASGSHGLATALPNETSEPVTTKIKATLSGITSHSITLTVTPAMLTSITIAPLAPSIASGTTQQFTATGTFNDGTTQDLTKSVTWHSNHTSVATISNASGSHGLVTALPNDTSEPVTTKITATLSDITSHNVTLTITPAPAPNPTTYTVIPSGDSHETISPSSPQLVAYGSTKTFTVTPSTGYAVSSTVTGTCPTGSWSGSNYTTGAIIADCSLGFSAIQSQYTVTYSGGANSTGDAPIDSAPYASGATVTVLASSDAADSGGLRSTDKVLAGWSTSASSDVDYVPGATFSINSNTILTAVWQTPTVGMFYPNGGGIIYNTTSGSPKVASIVTLTDLAPANWKAAQVECASTGITIGGVTYTDGYLPDHTELKNIYKFASGGSGNACSIEDKGGFCANSAYYWSSAENQPGSALYQDFDSGLQALIGEDKTLSVRAVRAINY